MNKQPKKKRTVSLSSKVNKDLETLCTELGINPHAYMSQVVAWAIRDDLKKLEVSWKQSEEKAIYKTEK